MDFMREFYPWYALWRLWRHWIRLKNWTRYGNIDVNPLHPSGVSKVSQLGNGYSKGSEARIYPFQIMDNFDVIPMAVALTKSFF